jgi:Mrp family chromosome partitioning ATPase
MAERENAVKRLLYSWMDVDLVAEQKRAAGAWPGWLYAESAYHDGLVLQVKPGTDRREVGKLLEEWYGARYDKRGLLLEGPEELARILPIEIETAEGTLPLPFRVQPSFRRVAVLPDAPQISWPEPFKSGTPPIVAFFSFKGGVGRTTDLLAFLISFTDLNPGAKALIIDADLEAPGITTLVEADRTLSSGLFSFTDYLAVSHSDKSGDFNEALTVAAYATRRQLVQVRARDQVSDHFFLPAHRDPTQLLRLDIRPEHLISDPRSTWIIGELVAELGRRLEAGVVLVDLRAGFSELVAPFLFDPRIRRIVVTTPSEQSVTGTVAVLNQLSKFRPPDQYPELYDPTVTIGFVLPELIGTKELQAIRLRLFNAYPDLAEDKEPNLGRLRIKETGFSQELLYLSDFSSAVSKLQGSRLPAAMTELVEEFVPRSASNPAGSGLQLQGARRSLAELSQRLEYAESGQGDRYLSFSPLRSLAKQFEDAVPIAVIVGSKGAGKTYTCLQVVRSKAWSSFVARTLRSEPGPEWGSVWPLLHSKNLEESAKNLIQDARHQVSKEFGLEGAILSSLEIEDKIHESLRHDKADERWWRIRWLKLIAESLGIPTGSENEAPSRMISHLKSKGKRLVVAIDGLEDLFPSVQKNEIQQLALRALLQGVPNYLREVPNCPLGILIFVRADLIVSAIPQNVGQFERLYEPFALRWDEEEALRLAVWIAREGNAAIQLDSERPLELISAEEARAALVPIWGKKLGSEKSREARTAEWVIAALSDFNGQIQARDLVRFFRYAAEKSIDAQAQDRVLIARAVRDAILPCSEQKIKEIKQEIEPLNGIFATLQESTDRRIPFDAPRSGLTVEQIQFLMKTGVLTEDQGEYFMPEIFRLGLGFQLQSGARPRVLSFARRGSR